MMSVLSWLASNWSIVITMIALVIAAILAVKKLRNLSELTAKQCLLGWVVLAEKDLGSGNGRLKLAKVYGWFVEKFPILKNFVTFETFSKWVDEALDEMKEIIEKEKGE